MEKVQIEKLKKQVIQNKITLIEMLHESKSGHPGGSLSCMDILTAIYERKIDFSKKERSKVVLSKGHAVPAVYSILNSKGIISDKEILTLRKLNSRLQGHPSVVKIPELDASTGLLGQGISIGIGMALAKKQNCSPEKVYVITGDGELVEGQNYEALTQAVFYNLDNLIV
ncbi:MAG: 1-deoxy-D-xylulose-5-phosphate synthase N-terminal domain-containing protein, partial [Sphaerochaetaceae bacterium]